ncbi:hypothetical protein K7432_013161 [Basidiobolus ranarum]|uniref:Wax synthase domain-containing protein n=1 Tax=Basidiobolus ranarum TaxID=34480 RepID=A0ABR2VR70_9FUNG
MLGESLLSALTLAGPYAQFVSLSFRSRSILKLTTAACVLFELWFIVNFRLTGHPLFTVIVKGGAAFLIMRLLNLGYVNNVVEQTEVRTYSSHYFRELFTLNKPGDPTLVAKPFTHHLSVAFLQYFLANFIFVYFREYPPRTNLAANKLLDFTDFELSLQTGLYCILLYLYMSFVYFLLFGSISYIVGATYYSIHDAPFISSSLREFWNTRWNRVFQTDFRAVIAQPVYQFSRRHWSCSDRVAKILAGLATFAFSGIFHEFLVGYLLEERVIWENFQFFMIQAVAMILEIFLEQHILFKFPRLLRIIITLIFFWWTSPLFINSYMRISIHNTCTVPLLF